MPAFSWARKKAKPAADRDHDERERFTHTSDAGGGGNGDTKSPPRAHSPSASPPTFSRSTEKAMRKLEAEGITRAQSPPAPEVDPVPVHVNVYNLMPPESNAKFSMLGIGIYHSGVEIYGQEWTFGGSRDPDVLDRSGIFAVAPKRALPSLHSSVHVGDVRLTPEQLRWIIKGLERTWTMRSYQLLSRNCNHFAEELVTKLGLTFPSWVNRAAKISNTLVPNSLLEYIMRSLPQPPPEEGDYQGGGGGRGSPPSRPQARHTHTHGGRPCTGHAHSHGHNHSPTSDTPEPPPPIPADLNACGVRQLRTIMFVRGISWDGCLEKTDLIDRIREYQAKHEPPKA